MNTENQSADTAIPPYLAGSLLLRGRTRAIWTVGILGAFAFLGKLFLESLGHSSNALLVPVVLSIAWMWGRALGVVAAVAGVAVNAYWADLAGVAQFGISSVWLDSVAIVTVAFLIGHIAQVLEGALGARARTHQAYTELELAARDRMLTITDQVPVGLYRTTPEGTIIGGNGALMNILGFRDRAAMLETNVWDHYVHSEDREQQFQNTDLLEGEWREFELRRADETTVWVRDWSRSVRGANGEVLHFDGVLEDVTEQHIASERFRAAFEDSPYGMTIATVDGTVVRANGAIADMMGVPIGEAAGMHYSEFTDEDELRKTTAALDKVKAGEAVRYEKRLRRRDGTSRWILVSLAPIREASGEPTHFISQAMDITERRMAEQALEDLVRSKDELIASVSHELRTPLSVVHGLAEELDSRWVSFSVPEQQEFIALISQQSAELAYIIEDLLVAAQADIGKLPILCESVDLLAQLDPARTAVVDLEVVVERVGEATPVAFADATRVRQIIRNLLTNAQRYGGPEVLTRCGADDSTVWIEVSDNGEGIPMDDVAKAFDPYHRAHNAAGQPRSVGLGLTVSRKLAELMGGSLIYRYELGCAIFRLELPAVGTVHAATPTLGVHETAATLH